MKIDEAFEIFTRQESIARAQYKEIVYHSERKIEEKDLVDDFSERIWLRGFLEACSRFRKILIQLQSEDGNTSTSILDYLKHMMSNAEHSYHNEMIAAGEGRRMADRMALDRQAELFLLKDIIRFITEGDKKVKNDIE